ncbi:MAG TPA: hypothetical protein VK548_02075 [Candidatus Acidoferrum sp.]|nr:hypothetical protein [Candidatus Acidoferrum sp.]
MGREAGIETAPRSERITVATLAAALFVVFVLTSGSVFWPRFDDVNQYDEANYVNSGRLLVEKGRVPVLAQNPLLAVFYGALYAVVGPSPSWFVLAVAVGRILLAALIWFGAVWLSATVGGSLAAGATLIFLLISPAVTSLVENSSDALFAGLSALALRQTVASGLSALAPQQAVGSTDRPALRHLVVASTCVALAALSRNDGFVLFPLFLALAVVGAGGIRARFRAAAWPFLAIVVGYLLVRALVIGNLEDVASLKWRSYMAFEQGQGVIFADRFPPGTSPYVEGHTVARRLYGTPDENNLSVFRAVSRNWPAFFERLTAALRQVPGQARQAYGESTSAVLVVLWLWGAIVIATARRSGRRGLAALGWPLHLGAYLLTFFRPGYFLLPCAAILTVAAVGSKHLLTGGWAVLTRRLPLPRAAARAALAVILGAVLVFHLADHHPARIDVTWGRSPSERAIIFMQRNLPPDARIAAYAPAPAWAARGEYVSLILTLRHLQTPRDLRNWLHRERVTALYVEDSLRALEPTVSALIESLIGTSLTVVFTDGQIRILTTT